MYRNTRHQIRSLVHLDQWVYSRLSQSDIPPRYVGVQLPSCPAIIPTSWLGKMGIVFQHSERCQVEKNWSTHRNFSRLQKNISTYIEDVVDWSSGMQHICSVGHWVAYSSSELWRSRCGVRIQCKIYAVLSVHSNLLASTVLCFYIYKNKHFKGPMNLKCSLSAKGNDPLMALPPEHLTARGHCRAHCFLLVHDENNTKRKPAVLYHSGIVNQVDKYR